jgi:hypothetical protein
MGGLFYAKANGAAMWKRTGLFKLAPTPARSGYSGLSLAARVIRRGAWLGALTRVAERQQNLREDEYEFGQR